MSQELRETAVMISHCGCQSNSHGIPVNSVRNLAHDCIRKIELSIMYRTKPRFLNIITTMISKN